MKRNCSECKIEFPVTLQMLDRGRGKFCSRKCKNLSQIGITTWMKGRKHTEKANEKNRLAHLGKATRTGIKHTEEARKKIGITSKGRWAGDKNPNWRGGIDQSKERNLEMHKLEYILWRTAVFTRDYWTCVQCGYKGKRIEADHIKPWSLYPELRYIIDNGRTLCVECHRKTDTWGIKVFKTIE